MDYSSVSSFHCTVLAFIFVLFCPVCDGQLSKPDIFAVVGGLKLPSIQYLPYHVGIYKSHGAPDTFKQICSGTLISTVHVVTAAHCFWSEKTGAPSDTSLYRVAAGKINREWNFFGDPATVQRRKLADVKLHRRYLGSATALANDIAVVTMDSPMTLTESVCVADVDWFDEWTGQQMAPGRNGIVAGWGISDTGRFSDTLQYVTLPYVDPDTCFDSLSRELKKFVTHDKFCAGFLNSNISVCPGDSGGGLVFHHPGTGKNFLRGVVSVAFRPAGNNDACFAQHYAAFTMVTSEVLQILQGHQPHPVERTRGNRGQERGPRPQWRHGPRSEYSPSYRVGSRSRYGGGDGGWPTRGVLTEENMEVPRRRSVGGGRRN